MPWYFLQCGERACQLAANHSQCSAREIKFNIWLRKRPIVNGVFCVCVWAEECAREGARRWVVESGATSSSRATISFQVASTHKHLRRKCFQQDFFCQRIYCNCLFLYFVYMHCISFPPLHNITTQPSATNTPSTERSTYVFLAPALALVVCCNCENVNKYKTV